MTPRKGRWSLAVVIVPGRVLSFVLFSAIIWLTDALAMMVTARALNLTLTLPQSFLLLAALGLSSAVPAMPGYVGIYQFVAAWRAGYSRHG